MLYIGQVSELERSSCSSRSSNCAPPRPACFGCARQRHVQSRSPTSPFRLRWRRFNANADRISLIPGCDPFSFCSSSPAAHAHGARSVGSHGSRLSGAAGRDERVLRGDIGGARPSRLALILPQIKLLPSPAQQRAAQAKVVAQRTAKKTSSTARSTTASATNCRSSVHCCRSKAVRRENDEALDILGRVKTELDKMAHEHRERSKVDYLLWCERHRRHHHAERG